MRAHRRTVASPSLDFSALANTQLFLLGQNVTVADGAAVGAASSWPETSNSRDAVNATAAQRPVLRKSGANISPGGKWMVEFDGNDKLLTGALPGAGTIPISVSGLTIFVYFKHVSLTNSSPFDLQMLFSLGCSTGAMEIVPRTSSDAGVGWPDTDVGGHSGSVRALFGAAQTGYQLLTMELSPPAGVGASWKFYRNGTQIGSTATNWQATDIRTSYTIGNSGSNNVGFNGAVGLIQVVSTVHSAAQRAAIESAILAYFG